MTKAVQVFTPTGAMRAWVTVLLLIVGFGLALGLTIMYVNKVDRANEAARQRQNEQTKVAVCALVQANVAADEETPPMTPAGKNKAAAWRALKVQFGC